MEHCLVRFIKQKVKEDRGRETIHYNELGTFFLGKSQLQCETEHFTYKALSHKLQTNIK
jgi:hypothetical protein